MPRYGTLPDPVWVDGALFCVACGYSLEGHTAPGRCPECGTAFGAGQLHMAGIPRSGGATNPLRTAAWVLISIAAFLISTFWGVFIFVSWVFGAAVAGAIIGGVIWLLATSQRERAGVERFVFTPGGIARMPWKSSDPYSTDTVFIPWRPEHRLVIKRFSPFWYRVRVVESNAGTGGERTVFYAGVRLPDALRARAIQTISAFMRGEAPPHILGEPPEAPGPPTA